jgi:YD repeat-containing protein
MKSRHFGLLFFFLLIVLNHTISFAQENYQAIIPPSPNASELGKYVELPVNYFTGIPEISIPLYTINSKSISVPISIDYYAGGIKVDQAASWVGLGWSMNLGGLVTRVVRGLPDERFHDGNFASVGLFNIKTGYNNLLGNNADAKALAAQDISQGKSDSEPDMFYFNFLNFRGQFFFDVDKNIHLTSQSDISIQYVIEQDNITEFTITTTDGNKFVFDQIETSWSNLPYDLPFNSSWYLSQIISQSEIVTFSYDDEEISEKKLSGQTQWVDDNGTTQFILKVTPFDRAKCKRLSRIDWIDGYIIFNSDLQRVDLAVLSNSTKYPKALTSFQIFNQRNDLIREFKFNYSLFAQTDCSTDPGAMYLCNRLKLDSVVEDENGVEKPPYIFLYNDTPLPPRDSYSQDYWGYYNGAPNTSLVPDLWAYPSDGENPSYLSIYSIFQRSSFTGSEYFLNIGGDRSPNSQFLEAGILKQIQYPTGGFLQLSYQPNTFFFDNENRTGGGLRILSTKFLADVNSTPITRNYTYDEFENGARSSGRIYAIPQYAHRNVTPTTPEILNDLPGILKGTFIDVYTLGGLGESLGSYIGYKNVTVSQSGNGKIEYTFDLYGTAEDIQDNCETGECIYKRTIPETSSGIYLCNPQAPIGYSYPYYVSGIFSVDQYPFAPNPNYDWNRGQIRLENYFSEENNLTPIKTIEYEYQILNFEKVPGIKVIYLGYKDLEVPGGCRDLYNAEHITLPQYARYYTYKIGKYDNLSGWKILKSKKEYLFDKLDNSKYTLFEQEFKYDSPQHHLITEEKTSCSDGEDITTNYTYPKDISFIDYQESHICNSRMDQIEQAYNNRVIDCTNAYSDPEARRNCIVGWWNQYPGVCHDENGNFLRDNCYNDCLTESLPPLDDEASAARKMIDKNMIEKPIQVLQTKAERIISALYTKFGILNNLVVPRTTIDVEISGQITSLPFPTQPYVSEAGSLIKSNLLNEQSERVYFDSFDNSGNLLQYHKKNDLFISYIWGYNECYPIIKAENVDQNTLQVAVNNSLPIGYSSLEELLTSVNGIFKMTSSAQKNLWRTFCSNLTNQSTLNKSLITIFTYSPLVGMTSQTDVNGITTYYEYDALGRLKLIKDNDGNILKTYKYHYRE